MCRSHLVPCVPAAISTTEPSSVSTPGAVPAAISTTKPSSVSTPGAVPAAISTTEPSSVSTPGAVPAAISTTEPSSVSTTASAGASDWQVPPDVVPAAISTTEPSSVSIPGAVPAAISTTEPSSVSTTGAVPAAISTTEPSSVSTPAVSASATQLKKLTFKVPEALTSRGRPKGHTLNAIGLKKEPTKKRKRRTEQVHRKKLRASESQDLQEPCKVEVPATKQEAMSSSSSSRKRKHKGSEGAKAKVMKASWKSPMLFDSPDAVLHILCRLKPYPLPVTRSPHEMTTMKCHPPMALYLEEQGHNPQRFKALFDDIMEATCEKKVHVGLTHSALLMSFHSHLLATALILMARRVGLTVDDALPTLDVLPFSNGTRGKSCQLRIPKKVENCAVGGFNITRTSLESLASKQMIDIKMRWESSKFTQKHYFLTYADMYLGQLWLRLW